MRTLIFMVLTLALVACSGQEKDDHHATEEKVEHEQAEMTYTSWNKVCPIRGEEVDDTVETVTYEGKEYGFCCSGCDTKFEEDPVKYSANLSEDGTKFVATLN